MTVAEVPKLVGQRVKRREDPRLITGYATYVDDIQLARMAHMAVVRSEHAHARLRRVDVSKARSMPGVLLVMTADDIPIPSLPGVPVDPQKVPAHPVLAKERVRHVGDPIAVVIAEDRYQARDAAEAVVVEYEPLPAVVDPEQAMAPDAPRLHDNIERNIAYLWVQQAGDVEQAFASAPVKIKQKMVEQRLMAVPMEPRGIIAEYRPGQETLTVWYSTQIPHLSKANFAALLGIPEQNVRVIAPEVGGGFGAKLELYAEDVLAILASRRLGRPVKWVESRAENFQNMTQGRGQVAEYELAADRDGRILALRARIVADLGAYLQVFTALVPTFSGLMAPGVYDIRNVDIQITGVFTNKTPTAAYRGAGRPEATYYIERMMDLLARELNMDPIEVRRRNFIKPEQFPYTTATGLVYDTGDYDKTTRRCLEILNYQELRREQERKRQEGKLMGIGFSTWVEICGFAPSAAMPGTGGWEYAMVKVERSGKVVVHTGASPHGQGEETAFAQIAADQLGVPIDDVVVLHGDTAVVSHGVGTFGSRALAVGGSAVYRAAAQVRDKVKRLAAHLMDASEEDLELVNGKVQVKGSPERAMSWAEVVNAAYAATNLPPGEEPGLEAKSYFEPPNFTFPFGTHAAVVEIDRDTGEVKLTRYIAVDDCGTVINPLLVAGQVHGGLVQGIAQALTEQVVYGDNGQLLTGTLMDYAVPKASQLPSFELAETVTPSPCNPLGVKGVGEAGTIASTPAVVNAVVDALRPFGVRHIDLPLKPEKIWRIIQQARSNG